ncbi:MAG: TolC family protein [Deltaproteobacteria bacterium]|nr:TolC family protein [Deltaproteobacteria bacterium]
MQSFANRAFKAILLLSALSIPDFSIAQEPPKVLDMSLREGVVKILENNLDITIERISPRIAEADIAAELGAFDASLFGSIKREDATTPLSARSSVAAGGLSTLESEGYTLDTGVNGKGRYGTEYTLEVKNEWAKETLNNFEFEYQSFSGITITQPLLKNFGYEVNTAEVSIARKNRDISVYQLKDFILDTVSSFGETYWDLVRVREELKVRMESQGLAETLFNINRRKLEAGAISALEVTQAEAAASSRRDDVIVARKAVKDTENTIKLQISSDVYGLKDMEIVPVSDLPLNPEPEGFEESVKKALTLRPDYLETKTAIEKNHIQIKFAENQRFPEVDLEASYGFNGIGSSFRDSFSGAGSNPEWSLGISFKYPLGNRAALGGISSARLSREQSLLKLKKLEQQIILGVDNSIKDILSGKVRMEAAKVSTLLTEESLRAEEKKLAAGRSTTFNVLRIQEDLAKARLSEIAAVAEYNKALIRYYKEKGTLLDELSIKMASDGAAYEVAR